LPGRYWDFWDHYLPLTEASLCEGLKLTGFMIDFVAARFLPYSMSAGCTPPIIFLNLYVKWRWVWRFFGKQFLVVAVKAGAASQAR
jgi:hypothetical protein